MKTSATLLALLMSLTLAAFADEPSAFDQALQSDTAVETHESNAEFFNVKYRKIETKQATFYAKAAAKVGMIDVYCGQPKFFSANHLKEGNSVVYSRSRKFLRALNESCDSPERKKTMELELEPSDKKSEKKQTH